MSDKVKIYCPDCGGSKRIPTEDPKSFSSYPCPTCRGTGEVEDHIVDANEMINSRSVQRREALQQGEDMPQFDKPEMPERIWAQVEHYEGRGYYYPDKMGNDCFLYLPADKVREVVRLHEEFRDLLLKYRFTPGVPDELNAKAEEIDNLQSALFPEGVEK